ncbi:MAG: hypothetical protein ACLQPD_01175 [Desulfomonilaceae bacterium]
MSINTISITVGSLVIFTAAQLSAMTCEECREIEKTKAETQQEITAKDKDLTTAFEKKEFLKVRDIRNKVTELRKKLLDLRAKDEECRQACRPDVIKAAECSKIREEIIKLEDESKPEEEPKEKSEEQIAKIDALYRDLQRCNKELKEFKKTQK